MKKIDSKTGITLTISFTIDEEEARALDALVGYGDKAFLEFFYKHLGAHYLQPYENGLCRFFNTIRTEIPSELSKIDEARKLLKENK